MTWLTATVALAGLAAVLVGNELHRRIDANSKEPTHSSYLAGSLAGAGLILVLVVLPMLTNNTN